MTTTATTTATNTALGGRLRASRSLLLVALFGVLAVAVVALTSGGPQHAGTYDPDNPDARGAQAVARVLEGHGVEVSVVRSADAFAATTIDRSTTVVVTSSDALGQSTTGDLLDHAGDAPIVVVDPGSTLLRALGVKGFTSSADVAEPVAAGCSATAYADLQIEVDDALALPLTGCFDDTLVTTGRLTLLGAGQLLTNDQVLRADNAAVTLRLLGGTDRLVWYVPSIDDLVAGDGVSVRSLLPDWIVPGLALALLGSITLVLWRARRLGPLATEPLPVVVKAIETTLSRGRLYRRSGDRHHAAAALRAAARDRVAVRLRLGAGADEATLIRDLARHVARPEAELWSLLGSRARGPASDRELISLANDLAALDREARQP